MAKAFWLTVRGFGLCFVAALILIYKDENRFFNHAGVFDGVYRAVLYTLLWIGVGLFLAGVGIGCAHGWHGLSRASWSLRKRWLGWQKERS